MLSESFYRAHSPQHRVAGSFAEVASYNGAQHQERSVEAHLEAGMGVVEPGIIAGQVELDVEVTCIHCLVSFHSCSHVELQQRQ